MTQRPAPSPKRSAAVWIGGLRLVSSLLTTVVVASEDLWVQLLVQVVTHLAGGFARRVDRRLRRHTQGTTTDAITPR